MRTSSAIMVRAAWVAVLGGVAAGAWVDTRQTLAGAETAAQKSELEKEIDAARKLQTEDLCEPVKSVRQGMLLWAPNADGKTWDLLQIYFPQYGGPNTIVVIDLGSGEVKQIRTERGWNFRLCPTGGSSAPPGRTKGTSSTTPRRARRSTWARSP